MTAFDPNDPATWSLVLSIGQVAAIYQRTPEAIRAACAPRAVHRFTPAPYRVHPYQWRKADVLRDVEGARSMRRAG